MRTPEGKYNYIAYLLADENGVSIKVAKYAGRDKVNLIENEEYGYCSLIKATSNVLEKMKIENITRAKVTSLRRIEKHLVEPVPLREAIVNAIVHNDFSREIPPVFEIFSDKIVLTSYGGLVAGQNEKDFFSCTSMPRNRELMRVFKDVGLVEQLGSGMSRILGAYDREIFEISEHFIKVIFPLTMADGRDNGEDNGEDKLKKMLCAIEANPQITGKELSESLGVSNRNVSRIIKLLKEDQRIVRIGSDRKGYWEVQRK